MNNNKKYIPLIILTIVVLAITISFGVYVKKKYDIYTNNKGEIETLEKTLQEKQKIKQIIMQRKMERKNAIAKSQKKIYAPVESVVGNEDESDTLFFTLYNDVIEMLHNNSIKIKAMDYVYSPENDNFVLQGNEKYLVCDVNMEIIGNYENIGKLIQDIYQYPYYIKINNVDVKPYTKDKKVLISNMSLRLYAYTEPQDYETVE